MGGAPLGVALPLTAALCLFGSGCETLKARKMAQDGVAKFKDGDMPGAAELFDKAYATDSSVPAIVINRGFTHMMLFQQDPKGKQGAASAGIAIEAFKKYMAMNITPQAKTRTRDYLLQTMSDAKRYDEAVDFFKEPLSRKPPDVEALTVLANIAKSVGRADEARKWFGLRVENYPKDPDGYMAIAGMDWDDLCNDSECRKPPDQKSPQVFSMPKPKRIEVANHGIELAKKAEELTPNAPSPLIFHGLLLRERQHAYEPEFTNPKNPNDPKALKALEECNKKKQADLDEAAALSKRVGELLKAAKGEKAGDPAKPADAKPGDAKPADAKGDAAKPADAKGDAAKAPSPEKK